MADEILKAFDPNEYETLTKEEVIESMKAFYGGADIYDYEMPDEYRAYVGTGNSFSLNRLLYSGRYADIKSGKVSPGRLEEIQVKQIEAFKAYIDKAPNLHNNTKLLILVNGDAFEGMLALAIGESSVGLISDNIRMQCVG